MTPKEFAETYKGHKVANTHLAWPGEIGVIHGWWSYFPAHVEVKFGNEPGDRGVYIFLPKDIQLIDDIPLPLPG